MYPEIRRQAQREGAEIHWGDETELRSDHQSGTSWGLKDQTPVVPGIGQRFQANAISAITNRGILRFRVFTGRFSVDVFIDFLKRLIRHHSRKVYLIIDRHPTHRAKKVRRWLARHENRTRLFYLPPSNNSVGYYTNVLGKWISPKVDCEGVGGIRMTLYNIESQNELSQIV